MSSAESHPLDGVLLGIGNPLLDISAQVPQQVLDKYELKVNNAILADPEKHLPLYEELVSAYDVEYIAGGATQNSIRVAQWMLQHPNATAYIGSVGKDKFGEQLKKSAQSDAVNVHYLEHTDHPTGTCAVLVHSKDRSLVANLAAANHYKLDHLKSDHIKQVWTKARFFYSAGFFLTVSPPSIMHLAEHAHEHDKIVLTNLAAPFIPQFFTQALNELLHYADFVFGNESEAEAYANAMKWEGKDAESVALKIAALPKKNEKRPRVAVITQGASATVVATEGKVTSYPVTKLDPSLIVDTNGAGDAFVGGFLSQLVQGKSIDECVRAGHFASRHIIQVSGCVLKGKPDFQ